MIFLRTLAHRLLGCTLVPGEGLIARAAGSNGDPGLYDATCGRYIYQRPAAARERKKKLAEWRWEMRLR
jgi:hypothetical protein